MRGVVHEVGGGVYKVRLESGDFVEASLRGRLKREVRTGSRVVVGDVVTVGGPEGSQTIESVEDRRSELVRRSRLGRGAKVFAANVDKGFIVVAAKEPAATPELIDRLLILVESSGIEPVVVMNKMDLVDADHIEPLLRLYREIGYEVLAVSADSGVGIPALYEAMCGLTSTLLGPSGVGKSSMLNAVDPTLALAIGELSRKTGTGRHTTVNSRMIPLSCGGYVADTPGFGDVGLWGVSAEEIAACLPEFAEPAEQCRFRGCAHLKEPDCGVQAAVEDGSIAQSRYASYVTLRTEADEAGKPRY